MAAARDAAADILRAATDFAVVHARLRAGRPYTAGRLDDRSSSPLAFAPAATVSRARRNLFSLWHPYLVVVPPSYDPTKRYPVRVYLQGDTSRPASSAESGVRWLNYDALARPDAIVVFPGAWNGFPWWGASQVEHIAAILDELKRTYNVDENRIFMLGSSDGGSAIYYHAMVATTGWAGFLPFNADPVVLGYPEAGVDAQLHASNLGNKPLFVIHGGRDLIYPAASIQAWRTLFESAGARITFRLKEQFGHETRWWDEEVAAMDAFMAANPRDPLPDRVTWETADTSRFNRAHWVIIDELGAAAGEASIDTPNTLEATAPGFGVGDWNEIDGGVRAALVQPGSTAAEYGLRDGDVVQAIEGVRTVRYEQVRQMLEANAGKAIQLDVLRDGVPATRFVSLPQVPAGPLVAFPRARPSGRIDVERRGNTVDVRTRGVRRFTLLLSPDEFDFSQPIVVVANGTRVVERLVSPSADVLLKWAAMDNDRTMLFGAELEVTLP